MPDETTKYDFPYPVGGELASSLDDTAELLAERIDLLHGETGLATITPSAIDTQTQLVVMYGRTYPFVPRVLLEPRFTYPAIANQIRWWTSNELVDRFTLNIRSYNVAARDFRWITFPVLP